ncbi:hypothetical protein GS636_15845 [Ruegeria sp. HKCCD4884]|uniref:hypothetical protein n=1 Tax=Ruegeria sp. HKCCD4884 TaxID=2683022 RepID=UPI0014922ADC|nr:hypothetical protein [Ruegeria sp. HKCCD4884]NOD94262.1 hypothetical protein [Ruegeria sp. HKCCD4884]
MTGKLLLSALLLCFAPAAFAQMTAEVQFQSGSYGTMVNGAVTGDEYFDYVLGAKAGQEMFADLQVSDTDGNGVVYFNILPPGSDGVAIYNGSIDGNTARINLPEDGDYTIRVYLMGNDRDTGKTVGYNLDLSIQ